MRKKLSIIQEKKTHYIWFKMATSILCYIQTRFKKKKKKEKGSVIQKEVQVRAKASQGLVFHVQHLMSQKWLTLGSIEPINAFISVKHITQYPCLVACLIFLPNTLCGGHHEKKRKETSQEHQQNINRTSRG